MSLLIVGGVAAFLALGQVDEPVLSGRPFAPPAQQDELLGGVVDPKVIGTDPATLHRKIRSEPRDDIWASSMETELRARYASLGFVHGPVRVVCGASLCEVAGRMTVTEATGDAEWHAINDSLFKLMNEQLKPLGLESITSGFGSTPDKKPSLFAYFRRVPKS